MTRRIGRDGFTAGQRPNGFAVQTLAGPDDGVTGCVVNAAYVAPAGTGPSTHIHTFDQLFVILTGRLRVAVADTQLDAEPGHVVILPAGVPHTQWNEGPEPELHLALLLPGPAPGEPVTIAVTFDIAAGNR